jgi:hypothetical protein
MAAKSGPQIFISYRRDDSDAHAGRVYDRLVARFGEASVFMDVDTIPLGVDFTKEISDAVAKCDVLIAVIGRQWVSSTDDRGQRRLDNPQDFVRLEIKAALERDVRVIPAFVQNVGIPHPDELPEDLVPLLARNGVHIRGDSFQHGVTRLIDEIEQVAAQKAPAPPLESSPEAATPDGSEDPSLGVDELERGERFGPFIIGDEIGRGAIGRVYRAEHELLGTERAVKVLSEELMREPSFRENFLREARRLIELSARHPSIVHIHDVGAHGQTLYIVMDYVAGGDLRRVLDARAPLDLEHAIALLEPVAGALDAAHADGLIHGGVKPANVLIDGEGRGLLGLEAVIPREISGLTRKAQLAGSPGYCAPEQIDQRAPLDARTDVYSFGCVFYECVTGENPFPGDDWIQRLMAQVRGDWRPARELQPDLREGTDDVFARALAVDKTKRFATCSEMLTAARDERAQAKPQISRE